MSPILLIALLSSTPAQASQVSVKSAHSRLAVDGESYRWVRPGKPMRVQVSRKKGQELHVDIIRLGPASAKQGNAEVVVRVGRKDKKVRVRPPLEPSRTIDGSTKLASYPVRHRFDLPFTTNSVRLTVTGGGADGVGIRVSVGKRKRSRLALAPLGSGNKKGGTKAGKKAEKKVERRAKADKGEKKSRRRRRRRAAKKPDRTETAKDAAEKDRKAKDAAKAARAQAAKEKADKEKAAADAKKADDAATAKAAELAAAKDAADAADRKREADAKAAKDAKSDAALAEKDAADAAAAKDAEAKAAETAAAADKEAADAAAAKGAEDAAKADDDKAWGEHTGRPGTDRTPPEDAGTDQNPPLASVTNPNDPIPPTTTEIVIDPERPFDPSAQRTRVLPFNLHVGAGASAFTLGSGLFPLGLHVGGRLLVGANDGWLSRYEVGIGFDVDNESTRVGADGLPDAVDWSVLTGRIRIEGAAKVFETKFELDDVTLPIDVAVVFGAGVLVGRHTFLIQRHTEQRFAFGPTARVGIQGALGVGPGAITFLVPVDASWDVTSGVQGYVPVVPSAFLGYRLSL